MQIGCKERHHSDGETDKRLDRAIAELAERQHGIVARRQLKRIGAGRGAIELRLARGRLHIIHPRVYAVGHRQVSTEGRWMAAVLSGGDGAVLSHGAAAAHWGIRPNPSGGIEVTTPVRRNRPGVRFHCSHLPHDEVTIHEGIPVTTVPRTLFDLASVVKPGQLSRAVREAEIRRLYDHLSLPDLLDRHPRRPGAGTVRALVTESGAGITRNDFEDAFVAFLDAGGFPRPVMNMPLWLGGRFFEVDCAWPAQRVIVELDSYSIHGTRGSFEDDRAKDRALTAAGWRVIRITWRQLRDEPEAVAADLRGALTQRPTAKSLSRQGTHPWMRPG